NTEPHRRPSQRPLNDANSASGGMPANLYAPPPPAAPGAPTGPSQPPLTAPGQAPPPVPGQWPEPAPHARGTEEERIDVPGSPVPAWVVVLLVVGVVALLAGAAFLLLR